MADNELDRVFDFFGQKVYSHEHITAVREGNLARLRDGKRIVALCPQEGFQERVLVSDADIVICGGRRGGGKTWVALYAALPYAMVPDVNMYGFRKYEDDIARGIWKSSKQVFRGFGNASDSAFEWKFFGGRGATMKMEHLQDPKKISDRFRGVEMAYIAIEELAEHTRENLDTLFDLLASNRTTTGVKPRCICTCNPVGRSNKLRTFLDWYIDPETDLAIPERSGHVRYFYHYGREDTDIAWGDSPEEVIAHPRARRKLHRLAESGECAPEKFVTSLCFIEGTYGENQVLQLTDPKYMGRISAKGGASTENDILGVWRDMDEGESLLTLSDMETFFAHAEVKGDGVMRASADVALTGDFFVIYALKGRHVCDIEAWVGGLSKEVPDYVRKFLSKNGVREENFTYDMNGLGLWLKDYFPRARGFNNKSAPTDSRLWNNLKSEAAEKWVRDVKAGAFSIDDAVLSRRFKSGRHTFTVRERLIDERLALKRKSDTGGRFEIIGKPQMKSEVGHSPDFVEGLFMVMPLLEERKVRGVKREGFDLI